VRQVVHHVPDSHMNGYTRCKLAMTEDKPTIRPYYEDRWAELQDGRNGPIEFSLNLLENLHSRWVMFLRSLSDADYQRIFIHPDIGEVKLGKNIGDYSWHGRHHTAQITSLRERMGW
jgi:DinB superfamily